MVLPGSFVRATVQNITQQDSYNFSHKDACDFATHTTDDLTSGYTYSNANGTITKDAVGVVTIDGGTIALNYRILVKNQTALAQNGIYTVTTLGSASAALVLTRAVNFNDPSEVTKGSYIAIHSGSANANTAHVLSANTAVTEIGVTELTFTNVSTNVTLANTNYLTISGQAITGGNVPVASGGTGSASPEAARTALGLGNVDNTADTAKPVSTAGQTALDLKANLAGPTFTGTVGGVTKAHVGLGSVDNTADTAKPVSTAGQTALNLKANLASPAFTGTPTGTGIMVSGTPSGPTATGVAGTIKYDASYIYICSGSNTWKRVAIGDGSWGGM